MSSDSIFSFEHFVNLNIRSDFDTWSHHSFISLTCCLKIVTLIVIHIIRYLMLHIEM